MKKIVLAISAMLVLPACIDAPEGDPWTDNFNQKRSAAIAEEVRPFIIQRQGCDHFRGEPPYDEDRRKFLIAQMEKLCTGTDAELKRLRTKYADSMETIEALADFEDCIEYESKCESD